MKYTVVISYFNNCDTGVYTYNSKNEMLIDLFFNDTIPCDEWAKDPNKYRKEIIEFIDDTIHSLRLDQDWNILYVENGEIKELHMIEISVEELINAYLTT